MSDRNERACKNCGSYLHHEDYCPGNPSKEGAPPPQPSEAELWKEVMESLNLHIISTGFFNNIPQLREKYVISRREDKTDKPINGFGYAKDMAEKHFPDGDAFNHELQAAYLQCYRDIRTAPTEFALALFSSYQTALMEWEHCDNLRKDGIKRTVALLETLQQIEQMSDVGDYGQAAITMKSLATNALKDYKK